MSSPVPAPGPRTIGLDVHRGARGLVQIAMLAIAASTKHQAKNIETRCWEPREARALDAHAILHPKPMLPRLKHQVPRKATRALPKQLPPISTAAMTASHD